MTAMPVAGAEEIRAAMEYYARQGWTDGLPVVPVTGSYLAEFLATTDRDPEEVLFALPHLDRRCTVRLAAINAAMAGCLPAYFPVVLAAWEAIGKEPQLKCGVWQSTAGTAPLLVVNGPVRDRIGLNSRGDVFGSGFRANATIGRAVRLAAINVFGLRPHLLDQATQGTPARFSACIAENEEDSPWEPLHREHGFDPADSAVTALVIRSCLHVESRHTGSPEQLALDLAGSLRRTGALVHETGSALVVLGPEHAAVFGAAGWSKDDLRRFLHDHAVNSRAELAAVGKDAVSRNGRHRLPADHPDAITDRYGLSATPHRVPALASLEAVVIAVAGADNAGVSAILETFAPHTGPLPTARIRDPA
ncbi:hypothetical protein AB0K12_30880 [Nonomuraea sp. NPDC049419]|uniref:hypothetical protein n=1 Tax=Nonomuraea sp. NPDC049419 TaxID=3155772 RepID=UPI00342E49D4